MYRRDRNTFIGIYRMEEAREFVFAVYSCREVWECVPFGNVEVAASMEESFDLLDLEER
jgi:hypothetical protein